MTLQDTRARKPRDLAEESSAMRSKDLRCDVSVVLYGLNVTVL